jgi:hypothetical protein
MLFRPPFPKIVCGYAAVFHEYQIGGGAAAARRDRYGEAELHRK